MSLQAPECINRYILGDPGAVSGGGKKSKRARKKESFLTFLRPNFFLARLDFFLPHYIYIYNCPWVSEDAIDTVEICIKHNY